jgi:beta-lactamase regulating signal transducer with metallopeptidase domain
MMAAIAAYLGSLVPALGWTLAHFLWQGALVALVLQLLLRTCRTAKARHDLALAALALMAVLPVATFAWLQADVRIVRVPAGFPGLEVGRGLDWETAVVAAWLTGVAALAIRMAGGLLLIERLRRGAQPLPRAWAERCRVLHSRMAGSLNVLFAQSEAVAAPLVAGWLKPMVLIPTAALTRFPVDQLEALILHELAHVRRLDAFANLIQSVVETLLFYHPAVWWVSRRVRIEREHCCDDLAVSAVRDPALYVRALQAIEAARATPFGVLAAGGGDLKSRAARILGLASAPAQPALSRTAAILILTAAATAVTHSAAVQARPSEAPRPSAGFPAPEAVPQTPPPVVTRAPRIVLAEADSPASSSAPTPQPLVAASAAPEAAAFPTPALAAGAQDATLPKSVSPLVVPGQGKTPPADAKIDMQGGEDDIGHGVAIWPRTAYQVRLDGRVTLRCRIDGHGLAERCDIASEIPKGKGFGKAALQMRTTLKLPPALGPDGPVDAIKYIAISFRAPKTRIELNGTRVDMAAHEIDASQTQISYANNPLVMRPVTMLDYPVWTQAANFDDLARAYPPKGGGEEGYAVAHCKVRSTGALDGCQVIKEAPEGRDFGKAALALASKFRVAAELATPRHSAPLWVDLPIRFPPPGAVDRTVTAPSWVTIIDPRATPKIFPPEAVKSGLISGRGVARCVVGADGALTQCAPEAAEPAGLGFGEAAAKLASTMKMNLWSADAAPVEGGVVHIPVRLNLKGG